MTRVVTCVLALCVLGTTARSVDGDEEAARPNRPDSRPKVGRLSGRFLFDGEPPARPPLDIPTTRRTLTGEEFREADSVRFSQLKLTDETLVVGADRGIQNILIWITDKTVPIPPVPPVRRLPEPATLTFKAGRLQPHVLAWWADQRALQLINADNSPLNLRWDPRANSSFNQLLSPKRPVTYQIHAEKLPTKIKSDVLPWLQPAIVFPCAHPYVAVTDAEGYFAMPDVPQGTWEFQAWHERCGWIKTTAWPQGKFTVAIQEGQTDFGTIKLAPAVFEPKSQVAPRNESRPVQTAVERPGWKLLSEQRSAANERDGAAEWAGNWRLVLPAGFHYDVTLGKTEDGLLKLDGATKITLLGTFAFSKNQLQLVSPYNDGIDDFIWQLNDEGKFVLITDRNRVGGRYIGAVLERIR